MPETVYLFLDCSDIRRIRAELASPADDLEIAWQQLLQTVEDYREKFPTSYDPTGVGILSWGPGNYMARDMALIYLVTGDDQYAQSVVRLLDLVTTNTPKRSALGPHPDYTGLLAHPGYGEVLYQSLLFAYLVVRDSQFLDDALRAQYDTFFVHQAQLLENWYLNAGDTTIGTYVNRNSRVAVTVAAATIALAFPDHPSSSGLLRRAMTRIESQMARWWETDGGWGENTDGYGYRVLEGLILFAEAMRRAGLDDMYALDFEGRSIHSFCAYFLRVVTPEGDWPAINDTAFLGLDPGLLRLCAQRTDDRDLAFAASQYMWGYLHAYGHEGQWYTLFHVVAWADSSLPWKTDPPAWRSTLLPETGLAILRSDWSHMAQYALLQFTSSKVHEHRCFGELYLFDRGPWLASNGYHTGQPWYEESIGTAQHSTLALDNLNQTSTGGDVVAFVPFDDAGFVSVTGRPYSILRHTRTLLWSGGLHVWIVIDDVHASNLESRHTLRLRWFVRDSHVSSAEEGLWSFTRNSDASDFSIAILPPFPTEYTQVSRTYPNDWWADAAGVLAETPLRSQDTRLVSVLSPSLDRRAIPEASRLDTAEGTVVIALTEAGTFTCIFPLQGAPAAEAPPLGLRGSAACVNTAPTGTASYMLYQGTTLALNGVELVESTLPLSVHVDLSQGRIATEAALPVTLTFYWPGNVSKLIDASGESVVFTQLADQLTVDIPMGHFQLQVKE